MQPPIGLVELSRTLGPSRSNLSCLAVGPPPARDAAPDALAHDHHPVFLASAVALQLVIDHLAAPFVGSAPVLLRELLSHQALHVGGLAQAQQAGLASALQMQRDGFVAVARVTPDQGLPCACMPRPNSSSRRPRAVLACVHTCALVCCLPALTCTSSTRRRLPTLQSVQHKAGPPTLAWVVAQLGALPTTATGLSAGANVCRPQSKGCALTPG